LDCGAGEIQMDGSRGEEFIFSMCETMEKEESLPLLGWSVSNNFLEQCYSKHGQWT
jgi:hypothetical protein